MTEAANDRVTVVAIAATPVWNRTPVGPAAVVVPYPGSNTFDDALPRSSNVRLRWGDAVFCPPSGQLFANTVGPEAGILGNVLSGTYLGPVNVVEVQRTVICNGGPLVRHEDVVVFEQSGAPGIVIVAEAVALESGPGVGAGAHSHTSAISGNDSDVDRCVKDRIAAHKKSELAKKAKLFRDADWADNFATRASQVGCAGDVAVAGGGAAGPYAPIVIGVGKVVSFLAGPVAAKSSIDAARLRSQIGNLVAGTKQGAAVMGDQVAANASAAHNTAGVVKDVAEGLRGGTALGGGVGKFVFSNCGTVVAGMGLQALGVSVTLKPPASGKAAQAWWAKHRPNSGEKFPTFEEYAQPQLAIAKSHEEEMQDWQSWRNKPELIPESNFQEMMWIGEASQPPRSVNDILDSRIDKAEANLRAAEGRVAEVRGEYVAAYGENPYENYPDSVTHEEYVEVMFPELLEPSEAQLQLFRSQCEALWKR